MTPEEFAEKMKALISGDLECQHCDMDDLMCQLLRSLGYEKGVEIFEEADKWYS